MSLTMVQIYTRRQEASFTVFFLIWEETRLPELQEREGPAAAEDVQSDIVQDTHGLRREMQPHTTFGPDTYHFIVLSESSDVLGTQWDYCLKLREAVVPVKW